MNNFFKYLLFLIPWFISSLIIKIDTSYYNNLNLPFFALPSFLFPIVWTILYIIIALYIFITYDRYNSEYLKYLIINFITNQLYTYLFFSLKNKLLAVIDILIVLYSAVKIYNITKFNYKKPSYLIIPYIIFSIYALILSTSILFLN